MPTIMWQRRMIFLCFFVRRELLVLFYLLLIAIFSFLVNDISRKGYQHSPFILSRALSLTSHEHGLLGLMSESLQIWNRSAMTSFLYFRFSPSISLLVLAIRLCQSYLHLFFRLIIFISDMNSQASKMEWERYALLSSRFPFGLWRTSGHVQTVHPWTSLFSGSSIAIHINPFQHMWNCL